jgi:hypothetical protein
LDRAGLAGQFVHSDPALTSFRNHGLLLASVRHGRGSRSDPEILDRFQSHRRGDDCGSMKGCEVPAARSRPVFVAGLPHPPITYAVAVAVAVADGLVGNHHTMAQPGTLEAISVSDRHDYETNMKVAVLSDAAIATPACNQNAKPFRCPIQHEGKVVNFVLARLAEAAGPRLVDKCWCM